MPRFWVHSYLVVLRYEISCILGKLLFEIPVGHVSVSDWAGVLLSGGVALAEEGQR